MSKLSLRRFFPDGRTALKLVSVIFAFVLWFYVLNKTQIRIEKSIMVDFKVPEKMSLAQADIREITFVLEGPRAFMRSMLDREDRIIVDIGQYKSKGRNSYEIPIRTGDISLPFGVDVLKIVPSKIQVKLERTRTKTIKVRPSFVGEISDDYKLVDYGIEPSTIKIKGPKSKINKMKELTTPPIYLGELVESGERTLSLPPLEQGLSYVDKKELIFKYDLRARRANMTVSGIRVRFLSSRKIIKAMRSKVSVEILADKDTFDKTKIEIIADIPDNSRGRISVDLKANLPGGVHLLKIHPEKIDVIVR